MTQTYLLEWLDSVVTTTLDPKQDNINRITSLQSKAITARAKEETQQIKTQFTIQVFSLIKEKQIKLFVENYHSALIIILDKLIKVDNSITITKDYKRTVVLCLRTTIDELLTYIESRYAKYLSLDARMPPTYLALSKAKIRQKLDKLKNSSLYDVSNEKVLNIVFANLYSFLNRKKSKRITFRQVIYKKRLVKELENINVSTNTFNLYPQLEQLLIYMNFNDIHFVHYFTQSIVDRINSFESNADKIENLLFYYKEFNQIQTKDDAVLHFHHQNLKKILSAWFKQEIMYQEKKAQSTIVPLHEYGATNHQSVAVAKSNNKILCKLSIDQTALILRASNELKILISNSMSQVFKSIVPFLSTPNKTELSYDSMRSKAYVAEERDKEIAIETLQRMIKRIKEY